MKKSKTQFIVLAVLIAASLLSFTVADRLEKRSAMMASTVADWERAKAYTLEYLNASTDEVINFKPTPDMRTFGQQMLHITEANYGMSSAAAGKTSPVPFGSLEKSDKFNTKEALTKEVMASYDYVIGVAKEMAEPKMSEMIKLFNRFDVSRGAAMEKVFEHQTHHRGQTTVYLRLKGITPPQEKLF